MAEFLGRIITSGKTRGFAKKAFAAGKKVRGNRMKAGRRVFAPGMSGYNKGWIKRGGRSRRAGKAPRSMMSITPKPRTINTSVLTMNPVMKNLSNTDQTVGLDIEVMVEPWTIPLYPTNTDLFSKLANDCKSWQYYRINSIKIDYIPNAGMDEPGVLMMAPVASYAAADALSDFNALSQLTNVAQTPLRQGKTLIITANQLNTSRTKWAITDEAKVNQEDDTLVQGYFAYCMNGVDGTHAGNIAGNFHISYDVDVYQGQNPEVSAPPTICSVDNGADAANIIHRLADDTYPLMEREKTPHELSTNGTTLTITYKQKGFYFVHLYVYAAGITNPTLAAVHTGATLVKNILTAAATQSYTYEYIVRATDEDQYSVFTQTNNARYGHAVIHKIRKWESDDIVRATY